MLPVNAMTIPELMTTLKRLILDSYTDQDLGMLLDDNSYPFDYAGLPGTWELKAKIYELVNASYREAQTKGVLELAKIVAAGRRRVDLQELVGQLEAAANITGNVSAQGGGSTGGAGGSDLLPVGLVAAMGLFESGQYDLKQLAQDLRPKLCEPEYQANNLPGRFHLSESDGQRLVAVLALEAHPDAEYLRWLSERVIVEEAVVGLLAVKALLIAALRLGVDDLRRVRAAAQRASDLLDGMAEDEESPTDEINLKKREMLDVTTLVSMRTIKKKASMAPEDLHPFLLRLVDQLDRNALETTCSRALGLPLFAIAKPEDPLQHQIIQIILYCRQRGKERDIIRAVNEKLPNEPIFLAAFQKYVANSPALV